MNPPSYYRWIIVALTLVNQAVIVGILIYSFALFVVSWLGEFDVARGYAMMAIFTFQVIIGLISPLIGRLMDQVAMRRLVVAGALLLSMGLFSLSLAREFWVIILIHATILPAAMVLSGTLASQTMVSKWFVDQRGLAIGLSAMGTSIGGLIFPLITTALISQFDWQTALQILSCVALFLLVPMNWIVLRFEPPAPDGSADAGASIDNKTWTSKEILRTRMFWIPVVGLIPINAAFGGVQFNLGAYADDLGFTQQLAAQLISIASISMIFGKFVFGGLGDRVDHRKLYWLMVVVLFTALMFYEGTPSKSELMIAAGLQGFATGGVMPLMGIMYAARFGTLSFGRVLGFVNMFLMIGSFGSLFSGWVFDLTQSYDFAFWFFAACLMPCAAVMYFLPAPQSVDR